MVANIVQPGLENLQHLFAGNTTALECALVDATELAFEKAVVVTEFLLLNQAETVIGMLAARLRTVNAGSIVAPFEIFGRAKDGHAKTAADANSRTCITSHSKI